MIPTPQYIIFRLAPGETRHSPLETGISPCVLEGRGKRIREGWDQGTKINYLEEGMRLCGFFRPVFGISGVEIDFFVPFFPFQWSYLVMSEAELGPEL
jgi:hypothetical protein